MRIIVRLLLEGIQVPHWKLLSAWGLMFGKLCFMCWGFFYHLILSLRDSTVFRCLLFCYSWSVSAVLSQTRLVNVLSPGPWWDKSRVFGNVCPRTPSCLFLCVHSFQVLIGHLTSVPKHLNGLFGPQRKAVTWTNLKAGLKTLCH